MSFKLVSNVWHIVSPVEELIKVNYEDIALPRYKCHKEVKAFKINCIEYKEDGAMIIPTEEGLLPALVTMQWISKHTPVPGGYFIAYKDGYESYSPAAPFEEGYSLVEGA